MNDLVAQGEKVQLRWKRMEDARDDYDWRADDELARLDATVALRLSFREYLHILEDSRVRHGVPNVCNSHQVSYSTTSSFLSVRLSSLKVSL